MRIRIQLLKNCTVQIIVPFEEFSGVVKDEKGCSKVESHGAGQNLNNNKNLQFYQFPCIFSVFSFNFSLLNLDPGEKMNADLDPQRCIKAVMRIRI